MKTLCDKNYKRKFQLSIEGPAILVMNTAIYILSQDNYENPYFALAHVTKALICCENKINIGPSYLCPRAHSCCILKSPLFSSSVSPFTIKLMCFTYYFITNSKIHFFTSKLINFYWYQKSYLQSYIDIKTCLYFVKKFYIRTSSCTTIENGLQFHNWFFVKLKIIIQKILSLYEMIIKEPRLNSYNQCFHVC